MGVKVDEAILWRKVKIFTNEIWGLEFKIPIRITGRMSRMYACIYYNKYTNKPTELAVAKKLIDGNFSEATIDDVILHELTHYAMMIQGKPHHDGDFAFETELRRVGAHPTGTIFNAGVMHVGVCSVCGKVIVKRHSKARLDAALRGHVSNCHRARIVYRGIEHTDDQNNLLEPLDPRVKAIVQKASIANFGITMPATLYQPVHQPIVKVASVAQQDLIQPGRKGITNAQMIPAMKSAIAGNSRQRLEALKKIEPNVFQGSIRYLGKKDKEIFERLMKEE